MLLTHQEQPMAPVSGGDRKKVVVVGVKMDSQSREFLTWTLVKVAQPGDTVVALHVLDNNEVLDREGKCSLFSLVKAFDSVLAVYEGFCNLKQVDLKLKVCRGSSVRKILVREAKSVSAAKVIVGSSRGQCKIRPSASVAKYCARKLPRDCWVLAVNNGKIVYQREGSLAGSGLSQGMKQHRPNSLLSVFSRTLSKNHRVVSEADADISLKPSDDKGYFDRLEQALIKASSENKGCSTKQNCAISGPDSLARDDFCKQFVEESKDDHCEEKSLAIVPAQEAELTSGSVTMLIKELPEYRPGWPLLRRAMLSDRHSSTAPRRKISVVQWALRLPSRHLLSYENLENKQKDLNHTGELDGESGAIVAVNTEMAMVPMSPDDKLRRVPKELQDLHERYSSTCRLFTYQELVLATSNFLADNLIGKGGSSKVYWGSLPDGKELAVKILKPSDDVIKEFVLEIEIITTLHHKNIISLVGFCYENNNLLLVYDFLSRGSLEENIHGYRKDTHAFSWNERYKVALGVAEALNYLHSGCTRPVIHRDVKSSNILLSDDFEPQLSDFGLAKWASTSSSHITCVDVAGTFGYLAPEYFMYGKVNEKIDVYAYGVVLLELLSGRKPISNEYPKGEESLVMWAKPILDGGKFFQLLDPSLGREYHHGQMERMVLAATLCIKRAPNARPPISLVLKLLQGDFEVTQWAKMQVNGSMESGILDDDDDNCRRTNIQSHLNLALLDLENDSVSVSSIEQNVSLEDYLQGRWSRSSSFD